MKKINYLSKKNLIDFRRNTNVLDLIKNSKLEEKREKRHKIVVATIAASALALSGYIISN
tara:strand:+ start:516 stop:695 length:180 start_codon:yes stop_codon:yes gene_type:complete